MMNALEKNTFNRVSETLHFNKTVRTGMDVVEQVRKGLSFKIVENMCLELGLSQQQFSISLGLNIRTLSRRKKEKKLHADESDKVYRLAKIYALAIEVLEDKKHAIQWLNTPKIPLGGVTPLSLLDTAAGTQEVEHLLGRIEYGVLS